MPIFRGKPELLGRFRDGQRDALEEVYRAYVDKVGQIFRFGFKVPGAAVNVTGLARRPSDVADAVQEVFAKSFGESARRAFDGKRDYGPYLFAIARNLLVDILRKSGHEIPVGPMASEAFESTAVAGDDEPYADDATMAIVRGYLAGLEGDLKRVHTARYVDGLSQRVAADHLGMSRQNLRTIEGRLRDGLRAELARSDRRAV